MIDIKRKNSGIRRDFASQFICRFGVEWSSKCDIRLIIRNGNRYKSKKCKEGINMRISENEYKIMQLLWDEGRPLTRAEILKGTEGRNWNPASIH